MASMIGETGPSLSMTALYGPPPKAGREAIIDKTVRSPMLAAMR
jgi:hypothetical protein